MYTHKFDFEVELYYVTQNSSISVLGPKYRQYLSPGGIFILLQRTLVIQHHKWGIPFKDPKVIPGKRVPNIQPHG